MAKPATSDRPDDLRVTDHDPAPPRAEQGRKPMVRPELTRHGSLPEVTGSFIGTFSP